MVDTQTENKKINSTESQLCSVPVLLSPFTRDIQTVCEGMNTLTYPNAMQNGN